MQEEQAGRLGWAGGDETSRHRLWILTDKLARKGGRDEGGEESRQRKEAATRREGLNKSEMRVRVEAKKGG
jgi:hypothetical protein